MDFYKEIEKILGYEGLDLDYDIESSFEFGLKNKKGKLIIVKCIPKEEKFINVKTNMEYKTKDFEELKKIIYMEEEKLTFGEKAVGLTFNPSGDVKVNEVKKLCAKLIDIIEEKINSVEQKTLAINVFRTMAFTSIIQAQMAIVKFLTWKENE